VAITHDGLYSHIDIDWNTDGEAIDVSGSLTNQSTSPTYISGLSSNISIISLRPITRFRRRWLLLALKLGDLSTTAITATPYQFRPVRIFLSRLLTIRVRLYPPQLAIMHTQTGHTQFHTAVNSTTQLGRR
jgi:hypothetical protein